MNISQNGINLIKKFEGCVLKVYLDAIGVKTVGYGHTGSDVNLLAVGTPITQQHADELLKLDLKKFESKVNKYDNTYHWLQNEFDALVSFAFNVGSIDQLTANGTRSRQVIAEKMLQYNKAGGKVLAGLTKRRKAEHDMFLSFSVPENVAVTSNNSEKKSSYIIGATYKLSEDLYVHKSAAGEKMKFDALTVDGKAKGYFDAYGYAILKRGTKVTCKGTSNVGNDVWMKIPSGWICAIEKGEVNIE